MRSHQRHSIALAISIHWRSFEHSSAHEQPEWCKHCLCGGDDDEWKITTKILLLILLCYVLLLFSVLFNIYSITHINFSPPRVWCLPLLFGRSRPKTAFSLTPDESFSPSRRRNLLAAAAVFVYESARKLKERETVAWTHSYKHTKNIFCVHNGSHFSSVLMWPWLCCGGGFSLRFHNSSLITRFAPTLKALMLFFLISFMLLQDELCLFIGNIAVSSSSSSSLTMIMLMKIT